MTGLFVFLLCLALLVGGYFVYGRFAERVYGVDYKMAMPCETNADGMDYVKMPTWRIFLIQLLNIAGLGPVFGAISGCLFGPVALLWIVFGCIFAGAMHDFLSALMSADHGGENLPEIVGRNLGGIARQTMRFLCIVLLLLVGVVFTSGPADLLASLTSGQGWFLHDTCDISRLWWCVIIMGYYFLATILPINVIIGKIYPFFGALFIIMALGMLVMLPFQGVPVLPDLDVFTNCHPKAGQGVSVWPMLFVTIACGAISGFHATQSPMMVRCLPEIRHSRRVFYGAMIMEGVVALVWATVGLTLHDCGTAYSLVEVGGKMTPQEMADGAGTLTFGELCLQSPACAVKQACQALLGPVGAVLAVLGVVVLPVSSGDTAMRCCRLVLADIFRVDQKKLWGRLGLALPVFASVIIISNIDFSVVWRYFGWANQALSCFTLWSIAVCLRRRARWHWIATLPALFMTTMCGTFLFYAPECGINLPIGVASAVGGVFSAVCFAAFMLLCHPADKQDVAE